MSRLLSQRWQVVMVLSAGLVLGGCSLAPVYQQPEAPIPTQWSVTDSPAAVTIAQLDWQSFVRDAQLRELIGLALDNNRDLRQAVLNVSAARAAYRIQRADRVPGVQVQGSGVRQRVPGDLSGTGASAVQENWQSGVGLAAFELDLFGRVRNLSQAALMEYLATEHAASSVRISLIAEVIETYLARSAAWQQHQLTLQTLAARRTSLELITQRHAAGLTTALDLEEARGLTEQARADLERADRLFRQAGHALNLLVGTSEVAIALPTTARQAAPLVETLAAGAPSDLLLHRPDVQAAEHRLRARNADIGAARAAFLPRISLTGLVGSASADLSNLFESGQRAWSFSPQLTLPIFAGGGNRANLDLAQVRKDIAVADYEKTVQVAFREVADALVAVETLHRETDARDALAQSSSKALTLAEARYRAGVDDHLRYLDAQRNDFANQMVLIDVATQYQSALASLFRALGGGWLSEGEAQ